MACNAPAIIIYLAIYFRFFSVRIEAVLPVSLHHVLDPYNFAQEVASQRVPAVLKLELPWGAQEWTPQSLLQKIGKEEIRGVKFSQTNSFQYCHSAPLDLYPHIVTRYRQSCFQTHNVTASHLLDLLLSSPSSDLPSSNSAVSSAPFVSYSSVLSQFGHEVEEDLDLLDLLSLPNVPRQTTIWLSPKAAITPLHYDISHNFFAQVYGFKHFLLIPPSESSSLSLYPSLHPGRQSVRSQGRVLARSLLSAQEVILGPGDVLYVPPHWMHEVTSLNVSISVAVWSHDEATTLYEDLMDHYAIPIPVSWDLTLRTSGLQFILQSLARTLHVVLPDFINNFLLTRYADVCVGDEIEEHLPCFLNTIALPPNQIEDFTRTLRMIASHFENIAAVCGIERRNIFLADFFEVATLSVIGAHRLRPFFRSLGKCTTGLKQIV